MNISQQLYQLQEVDLELEANKRALKQKTHQLGENQAVVKVRTELSSERQHLGELGQQQHSAEWEIDDITSKITTLEQKLYGGSIRIPKELASLQQEVDGLKARRGRLEDKTLGIMDEVALTEERVAAVSDNLEKLEAQWQGEQKRLTGEIKQLEATLSDLDNRRQLVLARITPELVSLYQKLKRQKGTAVARVDQGMCRGCQISLPTHELQRVRSGRPVQCSSCGRILFLV